jgi:hypothetical protein
MTGLEVFEDKPKEFAKEAGANGSGMERTLETPFSLAAFFVSQRKREGGRRRGEICSRRLNDRMSQRRKQMKDQTSMPLFVFFRRRDIEREAGFILAGQLIVDIPKRAKLKRRDQQMVAAIIQALATEANFSGMQGNLIVGWPGGSRPSNAVDIDNDEIMAAWASRSVTIAVRVDPRANGHMRIDSDLARQMKPSN